MARLILLALLFTFTNHFISGVYGQARFNFVNRCSYTVWPGLLSGAGSPPLSTTGFALQVGESRTIEAPSSWGGRFWGRTHCTQDSTGKFTCLTGDCGSGKVECTGGNAALPATLAEFKLDGDGGKDFYDVSLVDGYNLPMLVVPEGGSGAKCTTTGCLVDLNGGCPSALKVTSSGGGGGGGGESTVACKSACSAFNEDQYCCSGAYSTPDTCKPSSYSQAFKNACPRAYSYAYDDSTSTFTCAGGADYIITFCPSPNTSQKSSNGGSQNQVPEDNNSFPTLNGTMVYEGALDESSASVSRSSTCWHMFGSLLAFSILIPTFLHPHHFFN